MPRISDDSGALSAKRVMVLQLNQLGINPDRTVITSAERHGQRLIHKDFTFRELVTAAQVIADRLSEEGVGTGDRVLIASHPGFWAIAAILANLWSGVVSVVLDRTSTPEKLLRALGSARIAAVLRGPSVRRIIRNLRPFRKMRFVSVNRRIIRTAAEYATKPQQVPEPGVSEDDPAVLTFTTGSAGDPRAVVRDYGLLLRQSDVLTRHMGSGEKDLVGLPMFALNSITSKRAIVIPARLKKYSSMWDPAAIARQITDLSIDRFLSSVGMIRDVAEYAAGRDVTFPSMKGVFVGGGPIGTKLIGVLRQVFSRAQIHALYGSTEAEPVCHATAEEFDDSVARAMSAGLGYYVGSPVPEVQLRIDGPLNSSDDRGEILVAGPHVNLSGGNVVERDGEKWHATGDIGLMRDGSLWVVGRRGQEIRTAEGVHYPYEIETLIDCIPGVRRSAVIPVSVGNGKSGTCAVVIPDVVPPTGDLKDRITKHCKDNGKPVSGVMVVDALPLEPRHNSKVDYTRLSRLAFRQGYTPPLP